MQFYVGYDVSASIIRCLEDLHILDLLVILPHFYYVRVNFLRIPVSCMAFINPVPKNSGFRTKGYHYFFHSGPHSKYCRMIGHCNKLNRNIGLKLHKAPLLHICSSYAELYGLDRLGKIRLFFLSSTIQ